MKLTIEIHEGDPIVVENVIHAKGNYEGRYVEYDDDHGSHMVTDVDGFDVE